MFKKLLSLIVIFCFFLTTLGPVPQAHADTVLGLPAPGTMVNLSPAYEPVMIKGLTVHKDNPFLFDFIVDVGQDRMSGEPLKKEGEKLIKYFLASLAIPDKDVWVNLSPYEKSRMIPEALGQTDMGRDLLEQDYILKQITASLIYPEKSLGKKFWDTVYSKAQQEYGTTQIPVNTFNKVWIMADRAEVFEHNQTAFVVDSHLKVMLEEDYLALTKHASLRGAESDAAISERTSSTHSITSNIVRQIILPELEKEVNTGKNFANLRQIFNSIILSSWYKRSLKEALLNQVYADRSKVKGINLNDPTVKEQIYQQYLKAYKKGVFNYIKEDINIASGETSPRKYFSGGINPGAASSAMLTIDKDTATGRLELGKAMKTTVALVLLSAGLISSPINATAQSALVNEPIISTNPGNSTNQSSIISNTYRVETLEEQQRTLDQLTKLGEVVGFVLIGFITIDRMIIFWNNLWREINKWEDKADRNSNYAMLAKSNAVMTALENKIFVLPSDLNLNQAQVADLAMTTVKAIDVILEDPLLIKAEEGTPEGNLKVQLLALKSNLSNKLFYKVKGWGLASAGFTVTIGSIVILLLWWNQNTSSELARNAKEIVFKGPALLPVVSGIIMSLLGLKELANHEDEKNQIKKRILPLVLALEEKNHLPKDFLAKIKEIYSNGSRSDAAMTEMTPPSGQSKLKINMQSYQSPPAEEQEQSFRTELNNHEYEVLHERRLSVPNGQRWDAGDFVQVLRLLKRYIDVNRPLKGIISDKNGPRRIVVIDTQLYKHNELFFNMGKILEGYTSIQFYPSTVEQMKQATTPGFVLQYGSPKWHQILAVNQEAKQVRAALLDKIYELENFALTQAGLPSAAMTATGWGSKMLTHPLVKKIREVLPKFLRSRDEITAESVAKSTINHFFSDYGIKYSVAIVVVAEKGMLLRNRREIRLEIERIPSSQSIAWEIQRSLGLPRLRAEVLENRLEFDFRENGIKTTDAAMKGGFQEGLPQSLRVPTNKTIALSHGLAGEQSFSLGSIQKSSTSLGWYLTRNNGKAFRTQTKNGEVLLIGLTGVLQLGAHYQDILRHIMTQLPGGSRVYMDKVNMENPYEATGIVEVAVMGIKGGHTSKDLDRLEANLTTLVKRFEKDVNAAMAARKISVISGENSREFYLQTQIAGLYNIYSVENFVNFLNGRPNNLPRKTSIAADGDNLVIFLMKGSHTAQSEIHVNIQEGRVTNAHEIATAIWNMPEIRKSTSSDEANAAMTAEKAQELEDLLNGYEKKHGSIDFTISFDANQEVSPKYGFKILKSKAPLMTAIKVWPGVEISKLLDMLEVQYQTRNSEWPKLRKSAEELQDNSSAWISLSWDDFWHHVFLFYPGAESLNSANPTTWVKNYQPMTGSVPFNHHLRDLIRKNEEFFDSEFVQGLDPKGSVKDEDVSQYFINFFARRLEGMGMFEVFRDISQKAPADLKTAIGQVALAWQKGEILANINDEKKQDAAMAALPTKADADFLIARLRNPLANPVKDANEREVVPVIYKGDSRRKALENLVADMKRKIGITITSNVPALPVLMAIVAPSQETINTMIGRLRIKRRSLLDGAMTTKEITWEKYGELFKGFRVTILENGLERLKINAEGIDYRGKEISKIGYIDFDLFDLGILNQFAEQERYSDFFNRFAELVSDIHESKSDDLGNIGGWESSVRWEESEREWDSTILGFKVAAVTLSAAIGLGIYSVVKRYSHKMTTPSPTLTQTNIITPLNTKLSDKAMAPGGIDLNTSSGMQWKIAKDVQGVEMNIDPSMIARIQHEGIDSLSPVIFRITPIASIWPLVGLQAPVK